METNGIRHYKTGFIQSLSNFETAEDVSNYWKTLTAEQKSMMPIAMLEKYLDVLTQQH